MAEFRKRRRREEEQQAEQEPAAAAPRPAAQPEPAPNFVAADPPAEKRYWQGTGRRKTAVARVRIRPGTGKFVVNEKEFSTYFVEEKDRRAVLSPLETTNMAGAWDIWANVNGGGFTGQAGAVVLGLARAIASAVPESESLLRDRGLLTRDARMRERKKYGQPGARKRFQYSKR